MFRVLGVYNFGFTFNLNSEYILMQYFHLLLAYPLRMAEGEGSKTVIEHISRSPQGTLTDI